MGWRTEREKAQQVQEILKEKGILQELSEEREKARLKDYETGNHWMMNYYQVTAKMYTEAGFEIPTYLKNIMEDGKRRGFSVE